MKVLIEDSGFSGKLASKYWKIFTAIGLTITMEEFEIREILGKTHKEDFTVINNFFWDKLPKMVMELTKIEENIGLIINAPLPKINIYHPEKLWYFVIYDGYIE